MKAEEVATIKSHIRDINLNLLTNEYNIKYDISKRYGIWQRFKKNWELIKYVTKIGGVLTGSRALNCFIIEKKQLFKRKPDDFDFLITEEMMYKIAEKFNIQWNLTDKVISVKKQLWTSYESYSDRCTRRGAVDVHLIIKDNLSDFIEQDGVRLASFSSIVSEKLWFIDNLKKDNARKHFTDLTRIAINFQLMNMDYGK
jgi:hypothetical protein